MNLDKLKAAEGQFLQLYPLGFAVPEMEKMGKKTQTSWSFYLGYQKLINEMKQHTSDSLKPNNAAFCGLLMMSLK